MRLRLTRLFLLFGVLSTTSFIEAQNVTITQDGRYYVEKTEQTFSVNPGGMLTIDAQAGSIRIESWERNEVDVLVEKRSDDKDEADAREKFDEVEVSINQQGNDIRIQSDGFRRRNYRSVPIRFIVKVPSAYNLDLNTEGGGVRIGDLQGDVLARTSGGVSRWIGLQPVGWMCRRPGGVLPYRKLKRMCRPRQQGVVSLCAGLVGI